MHEQMPFDAMAREYEANLFVGLVDPTTRDSALSDIAAMMIESGKEEKWLDPSSAMVFICFAAGLHGAAEGIRENGEDYRAAKLHEMAQVILNAGISYVAECIEGYRRLSVRNLN